MAQRKVDISKYRSPKGLTLTHRVAHFLDWGATHMPYTYFPPNEILKAVNGYKRTPRLKSKEVDAVRSCMTRARQILKSEYNRGYDCQRKVGYRACVDASDATRFDLANRTRQFVSAKHRVDLSLELVDVRKLSNSADGKRLRGYVKGVRSITSQLTERRLQRLLPPETPETVEETE